MKKIYILHGWAYSTERWAPFVALLEKNGFEVITLKIPGLTAPLKEVWGLDDYIDWLKKNLDHEKEKVILLGHSNGGRIGLAFAAIHPEKIQQLILLDSAGIYHNEFPIRLKRLVMGSVAKIGKRFTNSPMLRKLLYKVAREHDYERASVIVRATMHNLIDVDLIPLLSEIKIPTTIIWGKHDRITPVDDGDLMHEKIKNSTLHIIENARHSPQFTHAAEVTNIILRDLS